MLGETLPWVILSHFCDKDIEKGTITSDTGFALRSYVSYSRIFQLKLQLCGFDHMPFFSTVFGSGK